MFEALRLKDLAALHNEASKPSTSGLLRDEVHRCTVRHCFLVLICWCSEGEHGAARGGRARMDGRCEIAAEQELLHHIHEQCASECDWDQLIAVLTCALGRLHGSALSGIGR